MREVRRGSGAGRRVLPQGEVSRATSKAFTEPLERRLLLHGLLTAHVFTDAALTKPGLTGSYVNSDLRTYSPQDDWRTTQRISGTRLDAALDFSTGTWGSRSSVGVTGGSDANWDNFSVQWDGYLHIDVAGTRLYTISDDSSRMWIDLNGDGAFNSSGPEFINNHWGTGQGARPGDRSQPIPVGTYKIRVQYEEGGGDNSMELVANAGIPLSTTAWTAVGPAPETHSWGNMPDSGRIETIAASPTDANTFYIGSAAGGVWKTTNAGQSWTPLTDFQASLNSGSIAIAPSNPSIVYVGTGEASDGAGANGGKGVLKSTDGGATWSLLGQNVFNGAKFYKVAVDPTNPNTVYAAGAGFLRKSTDGGSTWADIRGTITDVDGYTDLVISPTNPQTLFVAAGPSYFKYSGETGNGVYVSTNGGASWAKAGNFPNAASDGRTALAISPSNPSVIYASISQIGSDGGGLLKMMKSTDGGATWSQLTNVPNYLGNQGWYDTSLIVDPTNPSIAYAGGQISFLQTTDGGATWTDISTGAGQGQIHPDHHGIAFDAAGHLLDGDDGGIYRLDNPTPGSIHWSDLNTNLQITDCGGIALHPTDPGVAWAGGQDNGLNVFGGSADWATVYLGDAGDVQVDPAAPTTLYQVSGGHPQRSDDSGFGFTDKTTGIGTGESGGPLVLDPSNHLRLLFGTTRVYESTNRGDNWAPISTQGANGWTVTDSISRLAVSKSSPSTIYATAGSHLLVTFNDGATWQQRDISGAGGYNGLLVDPSNNQIAYALTNSGSGRQIYRTANGGQSWSDVTGNLPTGTGELRDVVLDPRSTTGRLFVCNDIGVYSSDNAGASGGTGGSSWSRFGAALPNAQVIDLELNTTLNILAAGTHGRGMWEIAVTPPASLKTFQVGSGTTAGAAQRSMVTGLTLTFDRPVTLASGALTLALHPSVNGGGPFGTVPTLSWSSADGGLTYAVAFSGAGVTASSIADGVYDLTLHGALVRDSTGLTLAGGDQTFTFHRLFGDTDGNATLNALDYARFKNAFGTSSGAAGYDPTLDYDGNGTINALDYAQFKNRFGETFAY